MKVGIRQKTLMDILEKGSLASLTEEVQSNTSMTSLLSKCIKITVDKYFTVESCTELIAVKASIPVTKENGIVVAEEGSIVVPAKELIHWAKVQGVDSNITLTLNKFSTPDVINTFDGDHSSTQDLSKYDIRKVGTLKMISKNECKTSGKWELDCFDPDQILAVNYEQKAEKHFEIQGAQLIEATSSVSFAAKVQDEAHISDTVSIQVYKDSLYFASTDSIRCALYKVPSDGLTTILVTKSMLIPCEVLNQVNKIIDKDLKTSFSYSEETQKVFISQNNLNIRVVSTDRERIEKFSSVQKLLDKAYQPLVEVPKVVLNELLVSASVVNSSCALFVFNKDDSTFTIKAVSEQNKYKPSIKQSIIPNITQNAKAVWGVKHLLDGIKVIKSDNVNIALPESLKSVKITGKDDKFTYYIMAILNNPYYRGIES